MILRQWRGVVATERAEEYAAYIERTGMTGYRAVPGNRGAQMALRDLGDGRTEFVTLSWWNSLDDIHGFAGADVETAVFYPEDDEYLLERDRTVRHFRVYEPLE